MSLCSAGVWAMSCELSDGFERRWQLLEDVTIEFESRLSSESWRKVVILSEVSGISEYC
jgi:hypothetical protein